MSPPRHDFEWSRSSTCANGACVEVAPPGRVVLVQDSKAPASGGGVMQTWSPTEWSSLLAVIKAGATFHSAIEFLPTGEVWLGFQHAARHEILRFDADEWKAFVSGVRRGEFDIDKLSGPVGSPGVGATGQVGSDTGVGAVRAATGAGVSGNPPAPVAAISESAPAIGEFCHAHFSWLCQAGQGWCQGRAPKDARSGPNVASMNVPAGRLTGAPASLSPQEAGQPGPGVISDEAVEAAALILKMNAELHGVTTTMHTMRLWARAALAAARLHLIDPQPRWDSGPLVRHVDEPVRCGCKMCWSLRETYEASRGGTAVATGGAPPDRAGVSGGKAGPGSTPRAPGPAEPTGCAS